MKAQKKLEEIEKALDAIRDFENFIIPLQDSRANFLLGLVFGTLLSILSTFLYNELIADISGFHMRLIMLVILFLLILAGIHYYKSWNNTRKTLDHMNEIKSKFKQTQSKISANPENLEKHDVELSEFMEKKDSEMKRKKRTLW